LIIRAKTRNLRKTKLETMKSLFVPFILLYFIAPIYAQRFSDAIPETREIVLNSADTIKKIRIFIANPKVKIEGNKFYAWYQKQIVLHTQGAWSGKLLQGKYESFYPNHNLLEQGIYDKGWRIGLWKQWYADGTLKEQIIWKNGLKHGTFESFDVNGQLKEKRKYKNGQLHGYTLTFLDGEETRVKYRKGEVLEKKSRSKTKKKIKVKKETKTPKKKQSKSKKKKKRKPKKTKKEE